MTAMICVSFRNSWDEVFLVGQRFTLADVAASIPLYHFQQQATLPLRPGTSETHGTYEELPIWLVCSSNIPCSWCGPASLIFCSYMKSNGRIRIRIGQPTSCNVLNCPFICHTAGPGEVTWTCHQTLVGNLLGDRGQGCDCGASWCGIPWLEGSLQLCEGHQDDSTWGKHRANRSVCCQFFNSSGPITYVFS